MNIFVTLNSNYVYPLCCMFRSLASTNKENSFDIFVGYSSLTDEDFEKMSSALTGIDVTLHKVKVPEHIFENYPILSRISVETYYRLLLAELLPIDVEKVLYLDPDIIINKDLKELYNIDISNCLVAGCPHLYGFNNDVNTFRLGLDKNTNYINAGVLLINAKKWRETISKDDVFDYVSKNKNNKLKLFLADQDVMNVLCKGKILDIDEKRYNLDEKTFKHFSKKIDLEWVKKNTVVIHFNGKHKPWKEENYKGELGEFFEKYK